MPTKTKAAPKQRAASKTGAAAKAAAARKKAPARTAAVPGKAAARKAATKERKAHQIIADLVAEYQNLTDDAIIAKLAELPALPDETDAAWADAAFWVRQVYPYLALADLAAQRRLRPAIELLLAKASYGDRGEIMRGLRHVLEGIAAPDWAALADVCMSAASSPRLGTKLWALEELAILEDERARPTFEACRSHAESAIREAAEGGLSRLNRAARS